MSRASHYHVFWTVIFIFPLLRNPVKQMSILLFLQKGKLKFRTKVLIQWKHWWVPLMTILELTLGHLEMNLAWSFRPGLFLPSLPCSLSAFPNPLCSGLSGNFSFWDLPLGEYNLLIVPRSRTRGNIVHTLLPYPLPCWCTCQKMKGAGHWILGCIPWKWCIRRYTLCWKCPFL